MLDCLSVVVLLSATSQASLAKRDTVDAGEDADGRIERRQHVAREKKGMMSAIQAARIAYQARLITATTTQGESQPGRFGARGPQRQQ